MSKKENDACVSCGLCCIYYPSNAHPSAIRGQWASIENDEVSYVPRTLYAITRKTVIPENYREAKINKFIKDKPDPIWKNFRRCVALEGTQTVEVKCSVYENRPRVCSDYEPGSDRCNIIREWGGLEKL